jgi:protein CpxP
VIEPNSVGLRRSIAGGQRCVPNPDWVDRHGFVLRGDDPGAPTGRSRMKAIFDERAQIMFRLTNPVTCAFAAATLLGTVALVGPTYAASSTKAASEAAMPVATENPAKIAPPDRVEKRISDLHRKLHITAGQETQWTVVAQAMRDNAKSMDTLIKERTANAKSMTAVDDLRSYEKLAEAHEDGLKKFIPVFQALYDSMSNDQKKSADAAFRSHGSRESNKKIS